jgi:hypothetical protein
MRNTEIFTIIIESLHATDGVITEATIFVTLIQIRNALAS